MRLSTSAMPQIVCTPRVTPDRELIDVLVFRVDQIRALLKAIATDDVLFELAKANAYSLMTLSIELAEEASDAAHQLDERSQARRDGGHHASH